MTSTINRPRADQSIAKLADPASARRPTVPRCPRRSRRSPDYAFLSDCHTGALVAPDGSVDWLCVPAFDSPSIFGSLVDRESGSFRLGPYGIVHPVSRHYLPGTNVMETTWRTRTGWMIVRDALTMGPAPAEDVVTPHTRPPADADADHMLVRTVECISGHGRAGADLRAGIRLRPDAGRVDDPRRDRHVADATGAGVTVRLSSDLAVGVEGNRLRARHVLQPRRTGVLRAVLG